MGWEAGGAGGALKPPAAIYYLIKCVFFSPAFGEYLCVDCATWGLPRATPRGMDWWGASYQLTN
jgi:hypothetical protein